MSETIIENKAAQPKHLQKVGRTFKFLGIITIPMIVSVGLAVSGIQGLILANQYHSARVVSYADFVQRLPNSGWYRIPDATIDYGDAVIRHTLGKSEGYRQNGYYAPVFQAGSPLASRTQLLLCVTDENIPAQTSASHPIEGLVETQLDQASPMTADLAAMAVPPASDFRVIDDAFRPEFGLSLTFTILGIPLVLLNLAAIAGFFSDKSGDFDDILNSGSQTNRRRSRPKETIK